MSPRNPSRTDGAGPSGSSPVRHGNLSIPGMGGPPKSTLKGFLNTGIMSSGNYIQTLNKDKTPIANG